MFQSNPQAKPQMLAAAYAAGDISLGKAAEVMGVTQEEMMDIVRREIQTVAFCNGA